MKRPLFTVYRAVWPTPFLVWLFVFVYGFVAAALWLVNRPLGNSGETVGDPAAIQSVEMVILGIAAGVYTVFRLVRFHPVCNQAYADWLKSTPWTAAQPLPLGPVHPVWQDAIVIGLLTAIAGWHAHGDATLPATVCFLSYLLGMTLLLAATRRSASCLALGFLWPTLVLPGVEGWPMVILFAAIIAVLGHGHRGSLKSFPWKFPCLFNRPNGSTLQLDIRIGPAIAPCGALGWPFTALAPKIQAMGISRRASLSLSALIGWWSFCLIQSGQPDPFPDLIVILTIMAAMCRLGIYLNGTTPPFSFWSRIGRGNLFVPGYDQVFFTPVLTVLTGILGAIVIKHSGRWVPAAESVELALIGYLLLAGGPTLRSWMLTGQHGFRPSNRANANRQMVRPATIS